MEYCTAYIDSTQDDNNVYYGAVAYTGLNILALGCRKINKLDNTNFELCAIYDLIYKLIEKFNYKKYIIFTDSMTAIKQFSNKCKRNNITSRILQYGNKTIEVVLRYTQGHKNQDYNWYCDRLAYCCKKGVLNDIWYCWN